MPLARVSSQKSGEDGRRKEGRERRGRDKEKEKISTTKILSKNLKMKRGGKGSKGKGSKSGGRPKKKHGANEEGWATVSTSHSTEGEQDEDTQENGPEDSTMNDNDENEERSRKRQRRDFHSDGLHDGPQSESLPVDGDSTSMQEEQERDQGGEEEEEQREGQHQQQENQGNNDEGSSNNVNNSNMSVEGESKHSPDDSSGETNGDDVDEEQSGNNDAGNNEDKKDEDDNEDKDNESDEELSEEVRIQRLHKAELEALQKERKDILQGTQQEFKEQLTFHEAELMNSLLNAKMFHEYSLRSINIRYDYEQQAAANVFEGKRRELRERLVQDVDDQIKEVELKLSNARTSSKRRGDVTSTRTLRSTRTRSTRARSALERAKHTKYGRDGYGDDKKKDNNTEGDGSDDGGDQGRSSSSGDDPDSPSTYGSSTSAGNKRRRRTGENVTALDVPLDDREVIEDLHKIHRNWRLSMETESSNGLSESKGDDSGKVGTHAVVFHDGCLWVDYTRYAEGDRIHMVTSVTGEEFNANICTFVPKPHGEMVVEMEQTNSEIATNSSLMPGTKSYAAMNEYDLEHLRRVKLELEKQKELNAELSKKLEKKKEESQTNNRVIEKLQKDLHGKNFQLDIWKRDHDALQRIHQKEKKLRARDQAYILKAAELNEKYITEKEKVKKLEEEKERQKYVIEALKYEEKAKNVALKCSGQVYEIVSQENDSLYKHVSDLKRDVSDLGRAVESSVKDTKEWVEHCAELEDEITRTRSLLVDKKSASTASIRQGLFTQTIRRPHSAFPLGSLATSQLSLVAEELKGKPNNQQRPWSTSAMRFSSSVPTISTNKSIEDFYRKAHKSTERPASGPASPYHRRPRTAGLTRRKRPQSTELYKQSFRSKLRPRPGSSESARHVNEKRLPLNHPLVRQPRRNIKSASRKRLTNLTKRNKRTMSAKQFGIRQTDAKTPTNKRPQSASVIKVNRSRHRIPRGNPFTESKMSLPEGSRSRPKSANVIKMRKKSKNRPKSAIGYGIKRRQRRDALHDEHDKEEAKATAEVILAGEDLQAHRQSVHDIEYHMREANSEWGAHLQRPFEESAHFRQSQYERVFDLDTIIDENSVNERRSALEKKHRLATEKRSISRLTSGYSSMFLGSGLGLNKSKKGLVSPVPRINRGSARHILQEILKRNNS
eukprot:g1519.t1